MDEIVKVHADYWSIFVDNLLLIGVNSDLFVMLERYEVFED